MECPAGLKASRGFCLKDPTVKIVVASSLTFLGSACIITVVVFFLRVKRSAYERELGLASYTGIRLRELTDGF